LEFFLEISSFFELAKICKNSSEISLGQKPLFFEAKTGVLGSKTGVSEHSEFTEYSEFGQFRTFRKLQKMMLKLNFENREKLVRT